MTLRVSFTPKLLLVAIVTVLSLIVLFHPGRFARTSYLTIPEWRIQYELVVLQSNRTSGLCSLTVSDDDVSVWNARSVIAEIESAGDVVTESDWAKKLEVKEGGVWEPVTCKAQLQIVVLIPFRNRETQLKSFLPYIHRFLQLQRISYRIVLIQQIPKTPWNKGKLFNTGFIHSEHHFPSPCYIFHDVDLIPENLKNMYACTYDPRHLSSSLDQFRYNLLYNGLFGGVVSLTPKQFKNVNGYSNNYYGWGGEDDDFWNRVDGKGYAVTRFEPHIARYFALSHSKARPNEERYVNLNNGKSRFGTDGLTNLNYTIVKVQNRPLYTWLYLDV